MTWIAVLAAVLLAGGGSRPPDRIELKSGETVEGYVLLEKKEEVVVLVKNRERRIPAAEVASVRSASKTLEEVLDRQDRLASGDAAGQLELAEYCRDQGLAGEAEVLALGALCFEPGNAKAHEFLGHVKRQGGWMTKRDKAFVSFDKLVPARQDMREPWKLDTSHYAVITNLALYDAVAISLDLERFYRAFYHQFGSEVELHEVVDPLGAGVYGDWRTFPEGLGARPAYFDPVTGQLLVNAAGVEPRRALVHEATHQILHATSSGSRGGLGQIPGWLDEGMAEYMAWSLAGDAGKARFDLGAIAEHHFRAHREAKKPYTLSRVLQFAAGDFHPSTNADLKYSQSYTLVHFFLHGSGGKYHDKFFAFLRSAYAGGSSSTDFKKAFDVPEKELEEEWIAHVKNPVR
jgi:hypothetical protein